MLELCEKQLKGEKEAARCLHELLQVRPAGLSR
jgi:hypothetical protein